MNVKENMKVTQLGIVCSDCGGTISDPELLEAAQNARWRCPMCGARHISLNDEMRMARVVECGYEEPDAADDSEGEDSCQIGHMDPEQLQKIHEEFMKRGTL